MITSRMSLVTVTAAFTLVLAGCSTTASQSVSPDLGSEGTSSTAGCVVNAIPAGASERSVEVNGVSRTYQIYRPLGGEDRPLPVVFSFHGRGSNSAQQLIISGISDNAERNNYVAVAPDADDGLWDIPSNPGGSLATNDTAYVTAILADIDANTCLDSTRRYASGFSMGSVMSLILACQPTPQFAAYGGVGAAFYNEACNGAPPAPLIYFHGTADEVVPFAGGLSAGEYTTGSIAEAMGRWAQHNQCATEEVSQPATDLTLTIWSSCADQADVEFYRVEDGGHTWPGADPLVANFVESSLGQTTTSINATQAMWEFFTQYQLSTA